MHFTTFGRTTPVASTFAFHSTVSETQSPPREGNRSQESHEDDATQLQDIPLEPDHSRYSNAPPITTHTMNNDSYWRSLRGAWASPTADEEMKSGKEEAREPSGCFPKCNGTFSRPTTRTPSPLPLYMPHLQQPPAYSTHSMSFPSPADLESGEQKAPPYTPSGKEPRTVARDIFWLGVFLPIFLFIAIFILVSPPPKPTPAFLKSLAAQGCSSSADQDAFIKSLKANERKWAWRCIIALGVWCLVALSAVLGWLVWRSITMDGRV